MDIGLTLVATIVTLPVGLIAAAAIKATSTGPVLFRQKRVGKDGTLFEIYKFRTMRPGTDTEVMQCAVQREQYKANGFKLSEDDPRITRVGRLLRKTSLDELPQLINVLRGEMSLVGIRPLLEDELADRPSYDQDCYRLFRPEMTGLWQVSGRSAVELDDRIELDRRYVEEWSLQGDLSILLRTPIAVLRTELETKLALGHAWTPL